VILDDVDALLIESFGAPESQDEVLPFLERVTAGRGIPSSRLAAVADQYREFGGVSPLNEANRDLVDRLRAAAPAHLLGDKVYLGNRNSEPFIGPALAQMTESGIRRAAVFITSAYSSYSGCRMYRENLATGLAESDASIELTVLPRFFDQELLADIWVDRIAQVWPPTGRVQLVFATHSLPVAGSDKYVAQHLDLARRVADRLRAAGKSFEWELAYQSRSGSPKIPWLGPDISETIGACAGSVDHVVVAPIGFCAPNLEISWDLDRVAAGTAADLGLSYVRAETPQSDSRFVDMISKMLSADIAVECASDCCPNPRGDRPAAG
jgi:ferrochelatase